MAKRKSVSKVQTLCRKDGKPTRNIIPNGKIAEMNKTFKATSPLRSGKFVENSNK